MGILNAYENYLSVENKTRCTMHTTLPLNEMTTTEKLVVLDQIWEDLMRNADNIPSPDWHKEVLSARAKRVKNGESEFMNWEDAKSRLRDEFK
jgi:hypothetical protein